MTKEFVKKKFEIDEDWQLALLGYPDWLQAMSEYAEQEAVLFTEWVTEDYTYSYLSNKWIHITKSELYTTSQLYQIFKSQQNAK